MRPPLGCGDSVVEIPSLHHSPLLSSMPCLNTFSALEHEVDAAGEALGDGKDGCPQDQISGANGSANSRQPCPSADDCSQLALALPTVLEFLSLYGFDASTFSPSATLQHWQLCSAYCGWMKFLKYKFSAFFASYLGGDMPKAPFPVPDHPSMLLGSTGGRFIRKMMLPRDELSLEFAIGVLYLKKASPRALDREIAAALEKCKWVLTTPQPIPQLPNCPVTFDDLRAECRRTVREIFRPEGTKVRFTLEDLHRPFAPSLRANVRSRRCDLGTFGQLRDQGYYGPDPNDICTESELWDEDPDDLLAWSTSMMSQCLHGRVAFQGAVELDDDEQVKRSGRCERELCDVNVNSRPVRVSGAFRRRVQERHTALYEQVRRDVSRDRDKFKVKLVGLAEALKIRVISKGPGRSYFLLKPIQMFLSELLGRTRCFALTRNTALDFTIDHVNDVLGSVPGTFASLDYEGATDNFNPAISNEIGEALCDEMELDDDLRAIFLKALTGHTIDGESQQWGQLMGSIVSFVVLCIGNAAVVRRSLELARGETLQLSTAPITINGDDGGVRGPSSFGGIWSMLSTLVGLKPSLGKVYFDTHYFNINSTSFILSPAGRLKHVPYVNMGLAYGLKRSTSDEGRLSVTDIADPIGEHSATLGSRHRDLIRTCPPALVEKVHDLFLRKNRDLLSLTKPLPLYAPEEFGGVGLQPIFSSISFDYDAEFESAGCVDEIRYSHGLSAQDSAIVDYLRFHPVPGLHRLPTDSPAAIRSLWVDAIRPCFSEMSNFDITDADAGFLDVSTYLLTPHSIYERDVNSLRQFRRNQTAWKRLRRRFRAGQSSPVHTPGVVSFDLPGPVGDSVVTVPADTTYLC